MRTPPNVVLPKIEDIKDEKIRSAFKRYNEIFFEIIPALFSDIEELLEKIEDLKSK